MSPVTNPLLFAVFLESRPTVGSSIPAPQVSRLANSLPTAPGQGATPDDARLRRSTQFAMRVFGHWIDRAGNLSGVAAAVLGAVLSALFILEDHLDELPWFEVLGPTLWTVGVVVFGFLLISFLAVVGHRLRCWRLTRRYAPRLESCKSWYVAGHVSQREYDDLRDSIEPMAAGSGPGARMLLVSKLLLPLGLMFAVCAILLDVTVWHILNGTGSATTAHFTVLVVFAILANPAAVAALALAVPMRLRAWELLRSSVASIEALQEEITRASHARRWTEGKQGKRPAATTNQLRAMEGHEATSR